MKQLWIRGIVAVGLLIAGIWFFEGRQIYAKVGDFKIYKKDIANRNKLIHMNYPNEKGDYGYKQLEDAYISYQIMRNHGYKKIEQRLETEVERVEANTKNPEGLARIKKDIFNNNSGSFRRAFIFPAAIEEEIFFGFYMGASGLHEKTLKRAQTLVEELKGKSLKEISARDGLDDGLIDIDPIKGIRFLNQETMKPISDEEFARPAQTPPVKQKPNQQAKKNENAEARFWLDTILKDLKPGDVITQPISQDEFWYVGRLVKRTGRNATVELLIVPKTSFSQLIEEEKKNVPIRKGFFLF